MRFVLALLLLLLTAAAAPPTDILAPDAESRWVPFDLTPGNQIRFTLAVDGQPITAILDTGVSYTVLSRAYVDRAKLPVRSGGSISVATLPATATGSAKPIEMLVGRDLTEGYALDIDYDARRFRLLPSGRMPFTGATAPLGISPNRLVYTGEVTLNGRRLRPMIVDTGDGNSVTFSSEAWASAKLIPRARTSTISFGLGGPIVSDLAILDELRTGTLTASDVEVLIEAKGGFSQQLGMAGRIGSGFLQKYRVLLDPKAGRMILTPGKQAGVPPLRSTSGLLVGAEKDRLRVLHVMRGSPAALGAWRAGDEICLIDNQPIPRDYAGSTLATWSIGTPGRIVAFDLCDGTRRALTLRHFY